MFRDRIKTGRGERSWESIFQAGGLRPGSFEGNWIVAGSSLRIDALISEGAWLCLVDKEIEDFEFKTSLTAITDGMASIFFRQHESGNKCYEFDLRCELQAVTITKFIGDNQPQRTIISAVNYDLTPGREYDIEIAVRGESITTYINGQLVNQVRDADFRHGGVCLTAWHSKTQFRDPKLRIY